jgi:hypothetical protein
MASIFRAEGETKQETAMNAESEHSRASIATCFHTHFLLGIFFDPKDGAYMFL